MCTDSRNAVAFGSAEVKMKDTTRAARYHPQTIVLQFWGDIAHDGTMRVIKANAVHWTISICWKKQELFFPELGYKMVDDMLQFIALTPIRGQSIQIWDSSSVRAVAPQVRSFEVRYSNHSGTCTKACLWKPQIL